MILRSLVDPCVWRPVRTPCSRICFHHTSQSTEICKHWQYRNYLGIFYVRFFTNFVFTKVSFLSFHSLQTEQTEAAMLSSVLKTAIAARWWSPNSTDASRAICYKAPGSRILSGFTKFIIWLEAAIPNVWSIVNLFSPSPPISSSSAINIPLLGFVNGTSPNDSPMLIISGSQAVIIVAMSVLVKMIISSIPIHNFLLSKVRKHW